MNAEFSLKDGKEFVRLSGGLLGKDEVIREATAADRTQFAPEYDAFKNPPAPEPDPKDAQIAALQKQLDDAAKSKGA